jgi:SAM-dependent methyltransferase
MRSVAERTLALPGVRFISVAGSAEATTLPEASVDIIVAGNAFHYFEPARARAEAERILRRHGRVLVLGHSNAAKPNRFMEAYGRFLKRIAPPEKWTFHQPDREGSSLRSFFGNAAFHDMSAAEFSHSLSWDALSGRFLSTSLAPSKSDPARAGVLAELKSLFHEFAVDGSIEFQLSWGYAWGSLKP